MSRRKAGQVPTTDKATTFKSSSRPGQHRADVGRRKGAQPGNVNALQHGLYSDRVTTGAQPIPGDGPETNADANLEREIKMLRKISDRVAALLDDADPDRMISLLNSLGAANIRVATLLKSQKLLSGKTGDLSDMLQQALRDVMEESG